jgi:hypothetical protein
MKQGAFYIYRRFRRSFVTNDRANLHSSVTKEKVADRELPFISLSRFDAGSRYQDADANPISKFGPAQEWRKARKGKTLRGFVD